MKTAIPTPFASIPELLICWQNTGIERIVLLKERTVKSPDSDGRGAEPEFVVACRQWFDAYWHRQWIVETSQLHLLLPESRFFRSVMGALATIGYGQVITYGELAGMAGFPGAARAVGRCMHQNPFPIVLPCHRVIARNNKWLYAYGSEAKRELLAHEAFGNIGNR